IPGSTIPPRDWLPRARSATARSERPMVAAWPWGHVNELCRFENADPVPFSPRDDAGLSGPQLDGRARLRFTRHAQPTRDDIEDLVAVRMNLAAVGRIVDHGHDADRHAVDPLGETRLARSGRDREVSVNIEDEIGNVHTRDLVHRLPPSADSSPSLAGEHRLIDHPPRRASFRQSPFDLPSRAPQAELKRPGVKAAMYENIQSRGDARPLQIAPHQEVLES